ncbi:MAG: Lar family restriction alleviation protein [Treponema sp.]|nr:Lar family restriction alleviation protein [Treponema sp.]
MTDNEELKQCDCGEKVILDKTVNGYDLYYVFCPNCGKDTGYRNTVEAARAAWNKRAELGGNG